MTDTSELWLIYSREHNAFWRPNSAGYTWDIDAAGRYTRKDAERHCEVRDRQPDGGPSEVAVLAPEAAQAIERLELREERLSKFVRDGIPREQHRARKCREAEQQLAEAREGRKDKAINAALSLQHFVRKSLGAGPLTNLPGQEGDLWRELNTELDSLRVALAAPAPEPSAAAELPSAPGAWSGTPSEAKARGYVDSDEPTTSEADEKPKDWYCGRCSEVVPLRERCRICGATKRESGIA